MTGHFNGGCSDPFRSIGFLTPVRVPVDRGAIDPLT